MHRLYQMMEAGELLFPAINVNDSVTKSKFDNLYGCRHSLIDGINRATDVMIGGKVAVVCGYGDVGKGCASHSPARVLVSSSPRSTRSVPFRLQCRALRSTRLKRSSTLPTSSSPPLGNKDIILADHMARMKHQAIVGNIGHFDNEIDMAGLFKMSDVQRVNIKPQVDEFVFPDGHSVIVLSEGRLLNLGNATGHPSFVMSCSFTNQVLAQMKLHAEAADMELGVEVLSKELDEEVARLHLDALGVRLTEMTQDQADYLGVPKNGPYKPEHYRY